MANNENNRIVTEGADEKTSLLHQTSVSHDYAIIELSSKLTCYLNYHTLSSFLLLTLFIIVATSKPIMQKYLYVHFEFRYPFFLAFIENIFFAPIALMSHSVMRHVIPPLFSSPPPHSTELECVEITQWPSKLYLKRVLPFAIALSAQFVFSCWATLEAPVSLLAVTKAAQPLLTALIAFIFFGKHTPRSVTFVLLVIAFGSALDVISNRIANYVSSLGVILAVTSAFATVIRSLFAERAMAEYTSLTLIIYGSPVSLLCTLIAFIWSMEWMTITSYPWSWQVSLYIVGQALLESSLLLLALATIEYTSAVSQAVAAAVTRPASTLLGIFLFAESTTFLSIIGMFITFIASAVYALMKAFH